MIMSSFRDEASSRVHFDLNERPENTLKELDNEKLCKRSAAL